MVVSVLAAEWVLPVTAEPISDGAVVIEGGRIAWVGSRLELPAHYRGARVRAFPRSILLPGWVNAHCHLNLTAALGLIPGSADRFTDWIREVIRISGTWPPHVLRQSVVAGLDLLASTGTTTVAHVTAFPELEPFLDHPLRAVVFHEPIGFREDRAQALADQAEEWLDAASAIVEDAGAARRISLGLAPHAPYSVSPALFRKIAALSEARSVPLSVHVAETRDEAAFLRNGTGSFPGLLQDRGAWDPAWRPPGLSPVRYLSELGVPDRPGAAIHCNYLDDEDIRVLAGRRLRPVWCPGSHAFFGHEPHPAQRLLSAGVPVALGTDSAASNGALNMLREVRLAAAAVPEVPREQWVRAATQDAAAVLGLAETVGSLEPGKAADLQVLSAAQETTDPLAALFEASLRVRLVMVDGMDVRVEVQIK